MPVADNPSLMRASGGGLPSRAKAAIRAVLPGSVYTLVTRWRANRIQRRYARLSLGDAFERIYRNSEWSEAGGAPHSGPGSAGRFVDQYCALLKPLLKQHHIASVADLGCGDFNTGRAVAEAVERYTGVDVARSVIESNTRNYGGPRIGFVQADLTRDPLPPADAALVRQVLQHLTNNEIQAALNNILKTYSTVFVTEHVYSGSDGRANLDIPHGPGTRVPMKSGVFIDQPPFSVPAAQAQDIEYVPGEALRTWVVTGAGPLRGAGK